MHHLSYDFAIIEVTITFDTPQHRHIDIPIAWLLVRDVAIG
jgi:hypothetical protein